MQQEKDKAADTHMWGSIMWESQQCIWCIICAHKLSTKLTCTISSCTKRMEFRPRCNNPLHADEDFFSWLQNYEKAEGPNHQWHTMWKLEKMSQMTAGNATARTHATSQIKFSSSLEAWNLPLIYSAKKRISNQALKIPVNCRRNG